MDFLNKRGFIVLVLLISCSNAFLNRAFSQVTVLSSSGGGNATLDFDSGSKFLSGSAVGGRHEVTGEFVPGSGHEETIHTEASGGGFGSALGGASGGTIVATAYAKLESAHSTIGLFGSQFFVTLDASAFGSGGINFQINQPVRVESFLNGDGSGQVGTRSLTAASRSSSFILKPPSTLSAACSAGAGFFYPSFESTIYSSASAASMSVRFFPVEIFSGQLRALEVNQVVQDWNNSVPLISGKRTFVRAFVQTTNPASIGKPVLGKLRGYRAGVEFPDSPLSPINSRGTAPIHADATDRFVRENAVDSVNFELPNQWAVGSVQLRFESDNVDLLCVEPAETGGNASNCIVSVNLRPSPTLPIHLLRVGFSDPSSGILFQPSQLEMTEIATRLPEYLPIDAADYTISEIQVGLELLGDAERLLPALQEHYLTELANTASPAFVHGIYRSPQLPTGSQALSEGIIINQPGVRVSSSILFSNHVERAAEVVAHELGHLLGRHHAVDHTLGTDGDGSWIGYCGETAAPEAPTFPYFNLVLPPVPVPSLGPFDQEHNMTVYGLAAESGINFTVYTPFYSCDLMSYARNCVSGLNRRSSKFTYEGFLAALDLISAESASLNKKDPPPAAGDSINHLLVRGFINKTNDQLDWLPFRCFESTNAPVTPTNGIYTLETLNSSAAVIDAVTFDLPHVDDSTSSQKSFLIPMPNAGSVAQVRLKKNGTVLGSRFASANSPAVQVTSPNGGENLTNDVITITWQGSDANGDLLAYKVDYSHDGGATWRILALDISTNLLRVARSSLKATTTGLIRVSTSDGFLCAEDSSDAFFTVANNRPYLSIRSPANNATFTLDQTIPLVATTYDTEQGSRVLSSNILWTYKADGFIGVGRALSVNARTLGVGIHNIIAFVSDAGNSFVSVTNQIEIVRFSQPHLRLAGTPNGGSISMEISAMPESQVTLETSTNLVNWTALTTYTQSNYFQTMPLPASGNEATRFYRANVNLRPPSPPDLMNQPTNITSTNGLTFLLTGVAHSEGPVSYQWYLDGAPVAAETNAALLLFNSQFFDSGTYYLVASNSAGVVTSAVSTVAITNGFDYQVIHRFHTSAHPGFNPWGPLAYDSTGWLYGCTRNGGITNGGTIFKMRTNGNDFQVLHSFVSTNDGGNPLGGVILGSDGALYGTCSVGGTNNSGTVFRVEKNGSNFSVLHHFLSFGDNRNPQAELLEGSDGKLYGTAYSGGGFGRGGLFGINKDGSGYQVLYGFRTTGNDGLGPLTGLIEDAHGFLYGTTEFGGVSNRGCIFRIEKTGANYLRIKDLGLVSTGAAFPAGTLLQGTDGLLYGTTYGGGTTNLGTIFSCSTNGAAFLVLKSFGFSSGEGTEPRAGAVQTPDGYLLGTTRIGGSLDKGVIYKARTDGPSEFQTIHDFTGFFGDGARSRSPLLKAADGIYYGATFGGGTNDQGTVFRMRLP